MVDHQNICPSHAAPFPASVSLEGEYLGFSCSASPRPVHRICSTADATMTLSPILFPAFLLPRDPLPPEALCRHFSVKIGQRIPIKDPQHRQLQNQAGLVVGHQAAGAPPQLQFLEQRELI